MRKKFLAVLALSMVLGMTAGAGIAGQKNVAQAAESETPEPTKEEDKKEAIQVTMSKKSGCYESAFSLEISSVGASKIYYTTDGSSPVTSSTRKEYTGALSVKDRSQDKNVLSAVDPVLFDCAYSTYKNGKIGDKYSAPKDEEVDKATVIKAVGVDSAGNFGEVETNTYFVGKMTEHIQGIEESCKQVGIPLSIMSISMDYQDLFDYETGIYVKGKIFDEQFKAYPDQINDWNIVDVSRKLEANYTQRGTEWERAAHIDYLESDGVTTECKLQQDCGIRIQGNYSRSDYQKGFRLYARNDYGKKNFNYSFFGEDAKDDSGNTITKFKKLTLRNGGNGAFLAKYNDAYWQSLVKDLACDTQASRVCVVYLDGEYWGIYILQEDYDDSYFENTHGVNKDDVVVYKGDAEKYACGYSMDEGTLPEGVTDEGYYFEELMDFFKTHSDLKSQEDYQQFAKLVDVDSVRDYFAAQIWMNNKWDWPGKNWSMWKTVKTDASNSYADGKWRFCFYDLDFGGVSGGNSARDNTIQVDNYKEYGLLDMDTENPAVLCFAYLMSNESFRNDFYAKLKEVDSKNFEADAAIAVCQQYRDIYQPLYQQFFTRFFGSKEAVKLSENAVSGGYGSYRCIEEFVKKRSKYVQDMIDWVEEFYKTHTIYNSALAEEDSGDEDVQIPEKKSIETCKITAKKGTAVIKVKTLKKAKVTITLSKKVIKSGKKTVKKVTVSASQNKSGTVSVKLSKKLTKGMKVTVTVAKSGYQTKTKKVTIK